MDQALDVWTDLLVAHTAGFEGGVAEIYMYRVTSHDPTLTRAGEAFRETSTYNNAYDAACQKATVALYELLLKFEQNLDCVIWIAGGPSGYKRLGSWFIEGEPCTHRVHIKVAK